MIELELDVLIFGGGVAGLWLLDELHRRSRRVLLAERTALGMGQTIASQGILHGGLKYSLAGWVDGSSRAVAMMPKRWRRSLEGLDQPDLSAVRVLSPCCYLWRTSTLASRAGLRGARTVIRTAVETVVDERPEALAQCPGEVLRVAEQVIDAPSLVETLRQPHLARMIQIDNDALHLEASGSRARVHLAAPGSGEQAEINAQKVIFCAGDGNADLRGLAGLDPGVMQRRPLHMVMVRGDLPALFGHCIDGNKTRATITTNVDSTGRTVWLVGGEIAEKGVAQDRADLIESARMELRRILPGVDFSDTQWTSYRINRAEGTTPGGRRPEGVVWREDGPFITAWPTKLVLAPELARQVSDRIQIADASDEAVLPESWPRPETALPPWEWNSEWIQ